MSKKQCYAWGWSLLVLAASCVLACMWYWAIHGVSYETGTAMFATAGVGAILLAIGGILFLNHGFYQPSGNGESR